jgi:hypothetical protein
VIQAGLKVQVMGAKPQEPQKGEDDSKADGFPGIGFLANPHYPPG